MSICQICPQNRIRRIKQLFKVGTFRLRNADKTLPHAGAKLYNYACHTINLTIKGNEIKIEDKFLNSFKNKMNSYLLEQQNLGDSDWNEDNFLLYKALKIIS